MLIHKGSLQLTNFGQTTSEFIFELFNESFEFCFLTLGFLQVLQSITQLRVQVGKSVTQVRKVVGDAVTEVMELVATWHKTGTTEDLTKDTKELDRIYTSAVYIAQSLRRQRALWSIRFATRPELPGGIGTGPLRFDPASMKDERDDETDTAELRKCQVEIMVTPALFKRGNMNGELFDKEEAMRAAIVVLAGLD